MHWNKQGKILRSLEHEPMIITGSRPLGTAHPPGHYKINIIKRIKIYARPQLTPDPHRAGNEQAQN